ncbi:hypothetical protein ALP06_03426 [Pseudomonas coronafaciens pv. atropurpurea]|nr:hypothetical protein ALP06_03426 [Pseudomonas coronafaciens pv. atropurpurea]
MPGRHAYFTHLRWVTENVRRVVVTIMSLKEQNLTLLLEVTQTGATLLKPDGQVKNMETEQVVLSLKQ